MDIVEVAAFTLAAKEEEEEEEKDEGPVAEAEEAATEVTVDEEIDDDDDDDCILDNVADFETGAFAIFLDKGTLAIVCCVGTFSLTSFLDDAGTGSQVHLGVCSKQAVGSESGV